jgi:hypothetical protein
MVSVRRGIVCLCVLLGVGGLSAASASATFQVINNNPSGPGSLQQEVSSANAAPGSTVTFAAGLSTITLSGTLSTITADMTIDGTGSPVITTNGTTGIFAVTGGNVTFEDLTIDGDTANPHDQAIDGGAISSMRPAPPQR